MIEVIHFSRTRSIRFNIAHVAHVTCLRVRSGVGLVGWIEMSTGRGGIARAAIAEFMNVKTMLARSQAGDIRLNLDSVGDFSEGDSSAHFVARGGMELGDGF